MNLKFLSISTATLIVSALANFANPAQAFNFTTNFTASGAPAVSEGDIYLDSVTLSSGEIRTNFSFVKSAKILYNDVYVSGNTGAASIDKTIKGTKGVAQEDLGDLDSTALVNALNNRYLSNIVDTEESGAFKFDLMFENLVDNVFLWERGGNGDQYGNSQLDLQALDAQGNVIGNVFQADFRKNGLAGNAGYQLKTTEMDQSKAAQNVGSLGISLSDLGVSQSIAGVRVVSKQDFKGADWKLMGSRDPKTYQSTPEPSIALGLGAAALVGTLRKRSKRAG